MPDNLTDQEKSVMLARAMGWHVDIDEWGKTWVKSPESIHSTCNIYQPEFMFLAWRVLNWAYAQKHWYKKHLGLMGDVLYDKFWSDDTFFELSPADAQRLWIDQILSLAIEAGIVEVQDAK